MRNIRRLRLRGLAMKEALQILRDPSALLIAFLLPFILLFVNGYGLSLDARKLPLAAVTQGDAAPVDEIIAALDASPYLSVAWAPSLRAANAALAAGQVRGILVLRQDFVRNLYRPAGWPAQAQLVINGTDPNTARLLDGYVQGALGNWVQSAATRRGAAQKSAPSLDIRYWFNPELRSADFIVPGVIALVMSITGTLLTALIVAREWERGTMEAMLASPAGMAELIGAKLGSYFILGMASMAMAVAITVCIFGVPLRGSVFAITAISALFLIYALAQGLFISTLARSQFVAAQLSFLTTMLPAMMLSGMLFDIATMPPWLRAITLIVPARYLVSALQTIFLSGDVWPVLLPDLLALAICAAIAVAATLAITRRRLD